MSRPKYHDLIPGDFGSQLEPYSFCELKYDGLYAEFVGDANGWSIHGRNGRLIRYGEEPCPECYLRGEMIIDTEWAASSDLFGSFVAWDVIYCEVNGKPYAPHAAMEDIKDCLRSGAVDAGSLEATHALVDFADWVSVSNAERMWRHHVASGDCEGLVFRSADGQRWGRMKRVVTVDYVCTGLKFNGPRVTALYGGLYIGARLETLCIVPIKSPREQAAVVADSLTRDHIGLVFEAAGNGKHASGALRHPRQAGKDGAVKWRPDKRAEECRL